MQLSLRQHGTLSLLYVVFCPRGAKNDIQGIESGQQAKVPIQKVGKHRHEAHLIGLEQAAR